MSLIDDIEYPSVSVHPTGRKLEFQGESSIRSDVSPCLRSTDYKNPHCAWVLYKGRKYYEGQGLYTDTSESFVRGGLPNVSRTLKANMHDAGVVVNLRIRKLTPPEYFRLMGVSEANIALIRNTGLSNSRQYCMAGNSIVVDVLEHIFRKLLIDKGSEAAQKSLF